MLAAGYSEESFRTMHLATMIDLGLGGEGLSWTMEQNQTIKISAHLTMK